MHGRETTEPAAPLDVPEDTVDLGAHLDPVRALLHRIAQGDRDAAEALIDVLGPRIHGLALHATGSAKKAHRLSVGILQSVLRDSAQLASGALPGDAAVLDRARRATVARAGDGDVRSLVAAAAVEEATQDRREVDLVRALLSLSPADRALVESAAQGRFPFSGPDRGAAAAVLARGLDAVAPLGDPGIAGGAPQQATALAALDALGLADEQERSRLAELGGTAAGAGVHRHAIEAAAGLTVLTARDPSRSLVPDVLADGSVLPSPSAPRQDAAPTGGYTGTYATPVLGSEEHRRQVGPPVQSGRHEGAPAPAAAQAGPPPDPAPMPSSAETPSSAPQFAFRPADEKRRARRRRGRNPWPLRVLAVLLAAGLVACGLLLWRGQQQLEAERAHSAAWAEHAAAPSAQIRETSGENGTWRAAVGPEGISLQGSEVSVPEDMVLQAWAEDGSTVTDLGVLTVRSDGSAVVDSDTGAQRVFVTREHAPGNQSGTPSKIVVADLAPPQ